MLEKSKVDKVIKILSVLSGICALPITIITACNTCTLNKIQKTQNQLTLNSEVSLCRERVELKINTVAIEIDELVTLGFNCLATYKTGSLLESCNSLFFKSLRESKNKLENLKTFFRKDTESSCDEGALIITDNMIKSYDYLKPFRMDNFNSKFDLELAGTSLVLFDDVFISNFKKSSIQNLCCNYIN